MKRTFSQIDSGFPGFENHDTPLPSSPTASNLSLTRYSDWLNSLSCAEAISLHRNLSSNRFREEIPSISLQIQQKLGLCGSSTSRDGAFWLKWLSCHISSLTPNKAGSGSSGHPRYKITVPVDLVGKDFQGADFRAVKDSVSKDHFAAFVELESPKPKQSKQIRFHVHHIAYNAKRTSSDYRPMSISTTSSASISHLCDQIGCIRLDHLEYCPQIGDNLNRQRCCGVILVVDGLEIITERPCKHATVEDPKKTLIDTSSLSTCCRKITIVCLGEQWPELADTWGKSERSSE